jgi:pilus assembly protein CpaB
MSTRGGTILVGLVAAALAAAILVVYLVQYRNSVKHSSTPVTVLVAKSLIVKNTPGDTIGSNGLFQATRIPQSEVKSGAITDPGVLAGKVATTTIFPGQQLTASDFGSTSGNPLPLKLAKYERAVGISIDQAGGLIGQVQSGDHVDVVAGFNVQPTTASGQPTGSGQAYPIVVILLQDITVLDAPSSVGSGVGGSQNATVTLEMTDQQAAKLDFAENNGKVWLILRSQVGALQHTPALVNLRSEIFGTRILTWVAKP